MTRMLLNSILLLVLIVLVGTVFFVRRQFTVPNIELLPGMVHSDAYGSQSGNQLFFDGKTLQPPVEGAVVRGFEPFPYKPTLEDAIRAGNELLSPLDSKDSLIDLRRGSVVFAHVCSPCHGAGGTGDGTIPKHGFPPPPSLFAQNALNMKGGQIYHIITYGQRNMPSFASQVVRADRWRVAAYIRSLQQQSIQSTVAVK